MRTRLMHAAAAMMLIVPQSSPIERLVSQPESRIWVEGTSTVRSFKCTAPQFTLAVDADGPSAVIATLAGQKAVKTVELTVPAEAIECGNGTMNDHMRKALKTSEHPAIRFTLSGYEVAKDGDAVQGTLHGTLALGGSQRPIDITAAATDAGNGAVRVIGSYEVLLSAHDLKRPSLMFGRIKVGDAVQVKFDVVLKR